MSSKKTRRYRGPSRPVDPRYAPVPGAPQKRDTFGIWLVAISAIVVGVIIVWAALVNGTPTATSSTSTTSVDMSAQATAQAAALATQVVVDATQTSELPRIEASEALSLHNAGNVTIVDVRKTDNFIAGHIKGALNIPEAQVASRMSEFPKLGNLILYCQ